MHPKLHQKNNPSTAEKKNQIKTSCLVEYELHGKPILAITLEERGDKWALVNEDGENLQLAPKRLYLCENYPAPENPRELQSISSLIKDSASKISIEKVWEAIDKTEEVNSFEKLFQESALENNPLNLISFRRALISDRMYFKRSADGFIAKTEEEVSRAREIKTESLKLESDKLSLRLAIQKRINGNEKSPIPPSISHLEEIAASGKKAPQAKSYQDLIDDLVKSASIQTRKNTTIEEKAFLLLLKIGHFTPDQNLIPLRLGRPVSFSSEERTEAERIYQDFKKEELTRSSDLRHLETITIDSHTSSDFDDAISLEYLENEIFEIGIHITDVSHRISPGSLLEKAAFRRATSIYCPDETIPMLPNSLSEGVLSLKEGLSRPGISFLIRCTREGRILSRKLLSSSILVKERMSYEGVDAILCDDKPHPRSKDLQILWDIASAFETKRIENGAIQFSRRDLIPEIKSSGKIKLIPNNDETPARKLISEFMIIANETAALFAQSNNLPFIYRTQEAPECDIEASALHVSEGPAREFFKRGLLKRSRTSIHSGPHSGLGLAAYCQVTSPIRRALDLILVRQLEHYISNNEIFYSNEELEKHLEELTPGLDEANIVQRERNRFWLLKYIEQEKFKSFSGTVVRAEPPRPLVEIDDLCMVFPFLPLKPLQENKKNEILGKRVSLVIERLDPNQDKMYLSEITPQ